MRIIYGGPALPEYHAIARSLLAPGDEIDFVLKFTPEVQDKVETADVLFGLAPVTSETVHNAKRARLIQVLGAGYDGVDVAAAHAAGIVVATVGGANATSVAEHAFALILSLCRRVPLADRAIREGRWLQLDFYRGGSHQLSGKTLGLVGLGRVGKALAKLVRGFDLQLLYYTRHPLPEDEERALGVAYAPLAELLAQADVVSVQVPLTAETRGLIGVAELALMKQEAILVNTSRGGVVDEEALCARLAERKLGGVGLDVFAVEPLDPENPLLRYDNVVLTRTWAAPRRRRCTAPSRRRSPTSPAWLPANRCSTWCSPSSAEMGVCSTACGGARLPQQTGTRIP